MEQEALAPAEQGIHGASFHEVARGFWVLLHELGYSLNQKVPLPRHYLINQNCSKRRVIHRTKTGVAVALAGKGTFYEKQKGKGWGRDIGRCSCALY